MLGRGIWGVPSVMNRRYGVRRKIGSSPSPAHLSWLILSMTMIWVVIKKEINLSPKLASQLRFRDTQSLIRCLFRKKIAATSPSTTEQSNGPSQAEPPEQTRHPWPSELIK